MSHTWPPGRSFWTDEFPTRTSERTAPYLFKGIVPHSAANTEVVLDGFATIRRSHNAGTAISAHARVYVGEERRDDLLDTVLAANGGRGLPIPGLGPGLGFRGFRGQK